MMIREHMIYVPTKTVSFLAVDSKSNNLKQLRYISKENAYLIVISLPFLKERQSSKILIKVLTQ